MQTGRIQNYMLMAVLLALVVGAVFFAIMPGL
jgi:hypothetical protein